MENSFKEIAQKSDLQAELKEIKLEGYELFKQDDQLRGQLMYLEQARGAVVNKLQALLERERIVVEQLAQLEKPS